MRAGAWAFVWGLLLTGCGREPYRFVEPPGSVLLLAVVSSQGDLRSARVLVSGEAGAAETQVELIEEGDRLLSWTLAPGALVDELGAPMSSTALAELILRSGPGPLGCGRCLVPSTRTPQILMPGDSCSVPSFAAAQVFQKSGRRLVPAADGAEVIGRAAPALRLERPGTCGCKSAAPLPLDRLVFHSVSPATDADFFGAAVLSGSTAIALAPRRLLLHDLGSGATRTLEDASASGGLPYSAVTTQTGLVLSTSDQSLRAPAPTKLERLRLEGERVIRTDLGVVAAGGAPAAALTTLAPGPRAPVERIYAYGTDGTSFDRPAIAHCDADQDHCALEAIDAPCRRDVGGDAEVRRLVYEESRGAVAISTHDVLIQQSPGEPWRCPTAGSWPPPELRLHELARGPRAVMLCGNLPSGAAFYASSGSDLADLRFSEVLTSTSGAACDAGWTTPGGFSFVLEGQRYDFDLDGRPRSRALLSAIYGPRVAKVQPLGGGQVLGRDRGSGLFVGPSESMLRPIWGSEDTDGGVLRAAGGSPEEPWLVSDSPLRVYHVRAATVASWRGRGETALYGWTIDAATIDSRSVDPTDRAPRLLLVMHLRDQPRRIARATLGEGQITSVELLDVPVRPLAVAELLPGEMLIVAQPANFYLWSGIASPSPADAPRPLEVDFDDPGTAAVEGAPSSLERAFLTGGQGAVWLATSTALFRISAVRAERMELSLPTSGAITGADARCPDALLLSVEARQGNSVLRLAGKAPATELAASMVELPQPGGVVGAAVGAVEDVGGGLGVFTAEGVLLRAIESGERVNLGVPIRSVLTRGSVLVIGGEGGRLVVGRPQGR